jgi:galactokinase
MYVGVSNLTKGLLMPYTLPIAVDQTSALEVKKNFDDKVRFVFNEFDNITEIVVLSPDGKSSIVITSTSNNMKAVFVPFFGSGL